MKGQALLIMILVMAVAMTIGLAVISRSITNIKISTEQEESARVFSVAEAGIEEALKAGFSSPQDITVTVGEEDITAHVIPSNLGGGQTFLFPKPIEAGDSQTIWLVDHDEDENPDPSSGYSTDSIVVYWGDDGTSRNEGDTPALETTLFYWNGSEFETFKYTVDPNSTRTNDNNFDRIDGPDGGADGYDLGGERLQFYKQISFPSLASGGYYYFLRAKLIYNNKPHALAIEDPGGTSFPVQGKCYESCATLETSGLNRCARHCQTYRAPLGIFDYALYSSGDLSKTL